MCIYIHIHVRVCIYICMYIYIYIYIYTCVYGKIPKFSITGNVLKRSGVLENSKSVCIYKAVLFYNVVSPCKCNVLLRTAMCACCILLTFVRFAHIYELKYGDR